jgi:hypothetical protein
MLEVAKGPTFLGRLNDSRDLFGYLKQMRGAFVEFAKTRDVKV